MKNPFYTDDGKKIIYWDDNGKTPVTREEHDRRQLIKMSERKK